MTHAWTDDRSSPVIRLEVCLLTEAARAFLDLLYDIAVEVRGVQDERGCRPDQVRMDRWIFGSIMVVACNRRTRRLSMLSILPISNAARWDCHAGTNRSSRFLCIRQQLRPPAGPILRAASAHSHRRAPSSSAEQ